MERAFVYNNSRDDVDGRTDENCIVLKAYYGIEKYYDGWHSPWSWAHKYLGHDVAEDQLRATHTMIDGVHSVLRKDCERT